MEIFEKYLKEDANYGINSEVKKIIKYKDQAIKCCATCKHIAFDYENDIFCTEEDNLQAIWDANIEANNVEKNKFQVDHLGICSKYKKER